MRLLAIAVLVLNGSAQAATITLTPIGSVGSCDLRAAVQSANTNTNVFGCVRVGSASEPDTILVPAGGYAVAVGPPPYVDENLNADGDIDILSPIIIQGLDPVRSQLFAPPLDRLFDLPNNNPGALTIRDITLYGGSVLGEADSGAGRSGGVIRKGPFNPLTLERVVVRGGVAKIGGGIHANTQSAALTLNRVTITGGLATQNGGGIAIVSGLASAPAAVLTNVTISGNTAPIAAALATNSASVTLDYATIAFNRTSSPGRAAVDLANAGVAPVQTIINSSVIDQNTDSTGARADLFCPGNGAINGTRANSLVHTSISNCTFSSSSGNLGAGVDGRLLPLFDYGGGIPVHAFALGSPLKDRAQTTGPLVDARGLSRQLPRDVGAFEEVYTHTIDSFADLPDLAPGDGLCRASGNVCTLRALTMVSNVTGGTWIARLPVGTYAINRLGTQAQAGDLDVQPATDDVPPTSVILVGQGDAAATELAASNGERVLQVRGNILSTSSSARRNRPISFALINATVRGGRQRQDVDLAINPAREFPRGGGVRIDGGHSLLYNVVVRDNRVEAESLTEFVDFSSGGGLFISLPRSDSLNLRNSTSARVERFAVIDNQALPAPGQAPAVTADSGGIAASGPDVGFSDGVVLLNGTVAGNVANNSAAMSVSRIANAAFLTIVDNSIVDSPVVAPEFTTAVRFTDNALLGRSIIANNLQGTTQRNCAQLGSLGDLLISDPTGCTISGDTTGNLFNVDPQLLPLLSVAGMPARAIASFASPAAFAIPRARCVDGFGFASLFDARGGGRVATECSYGALDVPLQDDVFANGFE